MSLKSNPLYIDCDGISKLFILSSWQIFEIENERFVSRFLWVSCTVMKLNDGDHRLFTYASHEDSKAEKNIKPQIGYTHETNNPNKFQFMLLSFVKRVPCNLGIKHD